MCLLFSGIKLKIIHSLFCSSLGEHRVLLLLGADCFGGNWFWPEHAWYSNQIICEKEEHKFYETCIISRSYSIN